MAALLLAQTVTSQTTGTSSGNQVTPINVPPNAQPGPGATPQNPMHPNVVTPQNASPTQNLSPQSFSTNAFTATNTFGGTNISSAAFGGVNSINNGVIVGNSTNMLTPGINTNTNMNGIDTNRPRWWEK
ncbi:MAG TPA: hypothetical protein VN516_06910 [Candidatus Baltobacteraceae bacterium]|nr:hypothetical protein [Candidatus Baltobacteraceae bacterium]